MRGQQVGSREFSVRGVAAGFLERLRNLWSACEIIWDGCKPFGAAANHLVRLQIVWGGCRSFGAAADYLGRLQTISSAGPSRGPPWKVFGAPDESLERLTSSKGCL